MVTLSFRIGKVHHIILRCEDVLPRVLILRCEGVLRLPRVLILRCEGEARASKERTRGRSG